MSLGGKSSETVRVFVRTRPTSNFCANNLKIDKDTNSITVHLPKDQDQHINNQQEDWTFKLDRVLHNAGQEDTYDRAARDIIASVLEGYNGTILAYGQTGAGKTFTMNGSSHNYKDRGIIPRAIGQIFRAIQDRPDISTVVRLSYLEIYNETFFDLLNADGGPAVQKNLKVQDDDQGAVTVKGLRKVVVEDEEAALSYLFEGETARQIAEHDLNMNSTRSHCIFTIYLESRSRVESSDKVIRSKLNLVDLAGSERVGKTGSSGTTLLEAKYINKSLTFLEQVVLALGNKQRDHIPFRQSKLTNYLRDSLGGNCKTRMIANIWAEAPQLDETISTLKFAMRMMRVSSEATINVVADPSMLVKKYQRQLKELRQELAMHDTLANRTNVKYDPYTPEEQVALRDMIDRYVNNKITEIEVVNLRQVQELFRQFKNIILDKQSQMMAQGRGMDAAAFAAGGKASDTGANDHGENGVDAADQNTQFVGDINDANGGFHLGVAGDSAKPSTSIAQLLPTTPTSRHLTEQRMQAQGSTSVSDDDQPDTSLDLQAIKKPAPSETEAFTEYKQGPGQEFEEAYLEKKTELQSKKMELKDLSVRINQTKKSIDALNEKIQMKRMSRPQNVSEENVEVIDEEEFALLQQLKKDKRLYQELYRARKTVAEDVTVLKGSVEQTKMNLCNTFLEWYKETYEDGAPAEETQPTQNDDEDVLDDGEEFARLERERLMETDPESISFFNARKAQQSNKKKRLLSRVAKKRT